MKSLMTVFALPKELVIFSIELTIAMLEDLPFRKPNWWTNKILFVQINIYKLSSNNFSRIIEDCENSENGCTTKLIIFFTQDILIRLQSVEILRVSVFTILKN